MMNHIAKKDSIAFSEGTVIKGKWHQTRYTIIKMLGKGMIGTVYLCRSKGKLVALKISEQQMATEINMLNKLNEVQDCHLGPLLYEADDWVSPNQSIYPFYAMEYIPGISFDTYLKTKGREWLIVILLHLLDELHKVHEAGWVFGDLKKEHILIQNHPFRIRCIDVGGMTRKGRSVKEYSEFYDRAYWQLGTRVAEPSYDLFALVMIVLAIYYPRQFKRGPAPLNFLNTKMMMIKELQIIHPVLVNALKGKYTSADAMKTDILHCTVKQQMSRKAQRKASPSYVVQSILIGTVASFYYVLSFFL